MTTSDLDAQRRDLRDAVDGSTHPSKPRVFGTPEGIVESLTNEDVQRVEGQLQAAIAQTVEPASSIPRSSQTASTPSSPKQPQPGTFSLAGAATTPNAGFSRS